MNNSMQNIRPNGRADLSAQQLTTESLAGSRDAVAYVNPANLLAAIFSDSSIVEDNPVTKNDFGELVFCPPIETMITLLKLTAMVQQVTNLSVNVKPDVFTDGFLPSTTVYVRNARTISELIEMFSKAAGLRWHVSDEGKLEIARDVFASGKGGARGLRNASVVASTPAFTEIKVERDCIDTNWSPPRKLRYV